MAVLSGRFCCMRVRRRLREGRSAYRSVRMAVHDEEGFREPIHYDRLAEER